MLGDVEAERLLLEPQELALVELGRREHWMLYLDGLVLAERSVEDRGLAGKPIGRDALAVAECGVEGREHSEPCRARGVERPALHERLERPLVQHLRVDALGQLPD